MNVSGSIAVFKYYLDLALFVIGPEEENEMIYSYALDLIDQSLTGLMPEGIERKLVVEQMSEFFLVLDELLDHGILMNDEFEDVITCIMQQKKPTAGISFAQVYIDKYYIYRYLPKPKHK